MNYDAWFDYLRLLEADGDVNQIRETYERAIANIPPSKVVFILCCFVHYILHLRIMWNWKTSVMIFLLKNVFCMDFKKNQVERFKHKKWKISKPVLPSYLPDPFSKCSTFFLMTVAKFIAVDMFILALYKFLLINESK